MQEVYDQNPDSKPRIISKQSSYAYVKRSDALKSLQSTSECPSRERMSCWWILVPFLQFFGREIDGNYDLPFMINFDETSLSKVDTINQQITIPINNKDTYIPLAPQQKGMKNKLWNHNHIYCFITFGCLIDKVLSYLSPLIFLIYKLWC
jgi:hypothetical protein